jgi:urease accessory protein UreF
MKTFVSVLAAILVAAVIIGGAVYGYESTLGAWEKQKEAAVRQLNAKEFAAIERLKLSRGGSITQMADALTRAEEDQREQREMWAALKKLLEQKPFLKLNDEESKLMANATDALNRPQK